MLSILSLFCETLLSSSQTLSIVLCYSINWSGFFSFSPSRYQAIEKKERIKVARRVPHSNFNYNDKSNKSDFLLRADKDNRLMSVECLSAGLVSTPGP